MSKRMTSETIIFDTDWLTEADFGSENSITVSIDYRAYDTLKIIVESNNAFNPDLLIGGVFQEFEIYKLENFGADFKALLQEADDGFIIDHVRDEDYFALTFYLEKSYWENYIEGIGSIYIKGVKR